MDLAEELVVVLLREGLHLGGLGADDGRLARVRLAVLVVLEGQLAALKAVLAVTCFSAFDPSRLGALPSVRSEAICESEPEKAALFFEQFSLSGEDQVWVTVSKIHTYMELLLTGETLIR